MGKIKLVTSLEKLQNQNPPISVLSNVGVMKIQWSQLGMHFMLPSIGETYLFLPTTKDVWQVVW